MTMQSRAQSRDSLDLGIQTPDSRPQPRAGHHPLNRQILRRVITPPGLPPGYKRTRCGRTNDDEICTTRVQNPELLSQFRFQFLSSNLRTSVLLSAIFVHFFAEGLAAIPTSGLDSVRHSPSEKEFLSSCQSCESCPFIPPPARLYSISPCLFFINVHRCESVAESLGLRLCCAVKFADKCIWVPALAALPSVPSVTSRAATAPLESSKRMPGRTPYRDWVRLHVRNILVPNSKPGIRCTLESSKESMGAPPLQTIGCTPPVRNKGKVIDLQSQPSTC